MVQIGRQSAVDFKARLGGYRTKFMKAEENPVACPGCRSHVMRRRKRASLKLVLASIFGQWPYRCEACGREFFLSRRYVRKRK
jgi:DNA-directed RNA polymerase subunit RPC12/RpoP